MHLYRPLPLSSLLKSLRHTVALVALFVVAGGQLQAAERTYYRYTNSDGVTVINFSIPNEYKDKGYEVVTMNGRVIETVPPAMTQEERDKLKAEQKAEEELAELDEYLLRRYSSPDDIKAAKSRKLAALETNISILEGKINGVQLQIEAQHALAAEHERAGRKVPETIGENLAILRQQIIQTQEQVQQRQAEYDELEARYDREIARFRELRPGS